MTELPSPGFPPPGRPVPLSWTGHQPPTPTTPAQPEGGAELPAGTPPKSPPVELTGDTFMDEHHPAHSPPQIPPLREKNSLSMDESNAGYNSKRDTITSVADSESSPIYSPIGGSALLPDSPHLTGDFHSAGRTATRPTSQDFPESPPNGSVRERVEELEKGHSP